MELQPNGMVAAAVTYVNGGGKMDSDARDAVQVSQSVVKVGSTSNTGRALSLARQHQR